MTLRHLGYGAAAAIALAICARPPSAAAQNQAQAAQAPPAPSTPLPWAYPLNTPGAQAPRDDGTPHHVPGGATSMTLTQIRNAFDIPDWYPDDHPPMPDPVAKGRRPDVRGCGYCHYPNGLGRPENSSVAGLPVGYIIQQMADFKSGARKSSEPRMTPPNLMIAIAKAATDDEVKTAAEYFASMKLRPWIRVVESSVAPKTKVQGGMMIPLEGESAGTEPIGQRIIEVPEDTERAEVLRDSKASFVAYVPVGSIRKGEALVTTGGAGRTIQCSICHGPDLRGLANVPGIAGRSPSYLVRQLYDMQVGNRKGLWSDLMKETVATLTLEDFVAIAAYTASRQP